MRLDRRSRVQGALTLAGCGVPRHPCWPAARPRRAWRSAALGVGVVGVVLAEGRPSRRGRGPGGSNRVGRIGQGGRIGRLARMVVVSEARSTDQPVECGGHRAGRLLDVRFDLAGLSGAPDSARLGVAATAVGPACWLSLRSLAVRRSSAAASHAVAGTDPGAGLACRRGGVAVATCNVVTTGEGPLDGGRVAVGPADGPSIPLPVNGGSAPAPPLACGQTATCSAVDSAGSGRGARRGGGGDAEPPRGARLRGPSRRRRREGPALSPPPAQT